MKIVFVAETGTHASAQEHEHARLLLDAARLREALHAFVTWLDLEIDGEGEESPTQTVPPHHSQLALDHVRAALTDIFEDHHVGWVLSSETHID
jgi:hypothetical protein